MGMVYNKTSLCEFLRISYMYFGSVALKGTSLVVRAKM